ncbi:hypothetical protein BC628DRAFT_179921 [Trametes gibbosa]|nr:hypothetical protein BC628DRAFT_179921 [Trametes gibbosa]
MVKFRDTAVVFSSIVLYCIPFCCSASYPAVVGRYSALSTWFSKVLKMASLHHSGLFQKRQESTFYSVLLLCIPIFTGSLAESTLSWMPLCLREFNARVSCENKELAMYDVRNEDDNTLTCWIASEEGKKLKVHWG